jgi:glutaminase
MKSAGMRRISRSAVHVLVALSLLSIGVGASAGAQRLAAHSPRVNTALTDADYQRVVDQAYAKFKDLKEGKNADYIPALAKVDPNLFGIALVMPDGKTYLAGNNSTEVSIQSISKVFTLARVLQDSGGKTIVDNTGVDATGLKFNSIVAIEEHKGHEMNPLVNAGAITTTALVGGGSASAVWRNIADTYDGFAGRHLTVLEDVYKSEAETNQRNRAIAMLMYAYGHFKGDPLQATDIYTKQCSVGVTAKDLAMMAATLANGGTNPVTKKRMLDAQHVPQLLSVMATAGLYDDSGIWLFNTGLPAKSGVGGGLIAVSPGKWGVAVVSPPLDPAGNSIRGQRAIEYISSVLNGNPLAAGGEPMSASGRR